MKFSKKNRTMLSGILVGMASIGAVAAYFDVDWNELTGFLFTSVVFVFGILVLAAATVAIFKLVGYLLRKGSGDSDKE